MVKRKRCPFNNSTFDKTLEYGNLDNLKWLYANSCLCSYRDTFKIAVELGNIENIKWLISTSYQIEIYSLSIVAKYGDLDFMKSLKNNNRPFDYNIFPNAIENGNLDNIKWLY